MCPSSCISAHAAQNWVVRGNLFKNLHNPDTAAYLWNPAVLFWRHSTNTVTEQNTFLNVDRAIAYGLDNTTPYFDHAGGVIRNNFVCLTSGLMSAARKAGSDGSIIAWNSPGTQIDHNSVLLNSNEFYAIEFRFSSTTGRIRQSICAWTFSEDSANVCSLSERAGAFLLGGVQRGKYCLRLDF